MASRSAAKRAAASPHALAATPNTSALVLWSTTTARFPRCHGSREHDRGDRAGGSGRAGPFGRCRGAGSWDPLGRVGTSKFRSRTRKGPAARRRGRTDTRPSGRPATAVTPALPPKEDRAGAGGEDAAHNSPHSPASCQYEGDRSYLQPVIPRVTVFMTATMTHRRISVGPTGALRPTAQAQPAGMDTPGGGRPEVPAQPLHSTRRCRVGVSALARRVPLCSLAVPL